MVWWEAVLSPALQVLFDKLAAGDIMQFLHSWNINDSLLEKLKISFYANTAVLDDAEEKQYDNPAVETWLDMLKDAVHEAEDILDQLATEALRCKLEATEHANAKPVRNWSLISTSLNSFPERIGSKIEKIIDRLEYIASQKDVLGLKGSTSSSRHGILPRTPTTPLLVESSVYGVPKLKHLPERLIQCLKALEVLEIFDCFDLRSLWQHDGRLHLPSLRHLIIRNCPSLTSLFYEEQEVPNKLEYLELDYCQGLEKLPHRLCSLASLTEIIIKECPKLKSFEELVLPSKLRGFAIRGCGMEFFPEVMFQDSNMPLEYLYLSGCYDFTSFTRAVQSLPTTFKQLTVDFCPNLQTLPKGMMHHGNKFLKELEIFNCSTLTSFPAGHLPNTLKTLTIWKCFSLEALPEFFVQDNENVSLESFRVGDCTSLKTLPNCLHQLKNLDYLEIDCCPSLVSFPEGGLPVTSLKMVNITNCENLKSLPTLEELKIQDCHKLQTLPEEDLPATLSRLEVIDCPLLERWCEDDWTK
ncbi:Rx, N-terminal, partial [Dillenia turbinata]